MSAPPRRFAPPPPHWPGCQPAAQPVQPKTVQQTAIQRQTVQRHTVQRQAVFNPLRVGKAERASAGDELLRMQGDSFLLSTRERNLRVTPDGTYNFVRVQGETRNGAQTFVSARSGHAGLAGGRPVLYAGTVRFDGGRLDWWSNYSGTYQPMAAFRQQAQLPDEHFIPWQKLQMGGVGLQRGMLSDQRSSTVPDKVNRPVPVKPAPSDTDTKAGPSEAPASRVEPAKAPADPSRGRRPEAGAAAPTSNPANATPAAAARPAVAAKGR